MRFPQAAPGPPSRRAVAAAAVVAVALAAIPLASQLLAGAIALVARGQ